MEPRRVRQIPIYLPHQDREQVLSSDGATCPPERIPTV